LHGLIADRVPLDAAERINHWLAAGEPERARMVAVAAATDAVSADKLAEARDHLFAVREACDLPACDPRQRVELLELIGEVAGAMGRSSEARDAYRAALRLAREHSLGGLERLGGKMTGLGHRTYLSRIGDRTDAGIGQLQFNGGSAGVG
jgi:hypothetical protein